MPKKTALLVDATEPLASRDVDARLGDVLAFMRQLWSIDHALQSTSKRMEASLGVTGPQRLVLRIVGRYPGISAGQLADVLHIHPSTLTGVLKRLEGRGMLERKADPDDARRSLFSLSEHGQKLDASRAGTVEAAVRRALSKLTARQLAAAQDALVVLAVELNHESDDRPARPTRGEAPVSRK